MRSTGTYTSNGACAVGLKRWSSRRSVRAGISLRSSASQISACLRGSPPDQISANDVVSVDAESEDSAGGSGTRVTWQSEQVVKPERYSSPQSGKYIAGVSLQLSVPLRHSPCSGNWDFSTQFRRSLRPA